jgi:hypothetical protein
MATISRGYVNLRPPWYFKITAIWYHDQCLATGNVSYGTTTSVFHMAMCHTETRPVPFTWQCVINYKSIRQHLCFCVDRKCKITYFYVTNNPFRLNVTLLFFGWAFTTILFTMTSVFHLTLCHMVPRPVYFTWQCVIRYHDQCNLAICHAVPQPV